jgi:glucose/arabinose dehydrogenase
MRSSASLFALLSLFIALATLTSAETRAQVCDPNDRVPFAGHQLPLDEVFAPTPMTDEDAFPQLPSFSSPVLITGAGDGSNRLFVLEQGGRIQVFFNFKASISYALFADLRFDMPTGAIGTGGERGLLGLAFDPDFGVEGMPGYGLLYVNYTDVSGDTRVVRLTASRTSPSSPFFDTVDPATAELLVGFDQPFGNHNGGMIAFGPDGMLYISTGDGGSGNDPDNLAQNLTTKLGKMLRIDPHAPAPHVPPDNPYAGHATNDETIWHYGLRNPWRFSFDRETGDLWIGDVGQNRWEEIDYLPADAPAPADFGWKICEASRIRGGFTTCAHPHTFPVLEHGRTEATSITGGYVYRGTRLPELYGQYIYGDFGSGRIWAWDRLSVDEGTGLGQPEELGRFGSVSSFGEDDAGELYFLDYGAGRVRRLVRAGAGGPSTFPRLLSETGFFTDVASLTPAPGMLEYQVAAPLWSDGAAKRRWLALPGLSQIPFHPTDPWSFPLGTAMVKHFELDTGNGMRRLETRVFYLQDTGWLGLTYRWAEDGSDAFLLERAVSEEIDVLIDGQPGLQTWNYPSPGDCLGCHTQPAGRVLGVRARQLGGSGTGPSNDLDAWNCLGVFTTDIGPTARFHAYSGLEDATASRLERARAYMAVNCAVCHQPGGPVPGNQDMRFDPLLGDMNMIGVAPSGDGFGLNAPERIKAGVPGESVAWHRMQASDPAIRMARGTLVADATAVTLFDDWIRFDLSTLDSDEDGVADAIDSCPQDPDSGLDGDGDGVDDVCDPDAAPDLDAIPLNPTAIGIGEAPTLRASIGNAGPGVASGEFQATFHLSSDTIFDAATDPLIGDCISPGAAPGSAVDCLDTTAPAPSDVLGIGLGQVGTAYWVACADSLGEVFESDEGNNCTLDPTPVLIPEPASALQGVTLLTLAQLRRRRRRARSALAGR